MPASAQLTEDNLHEINKIDNDAKESTASNAVSPSSHTLSARSRSHTPSSEISLSRRLPRQQRKTHLVEAPPARNQHKRRRRRPIEDTSVASSGPDTPSSGFTYDTSDAIAAPISNQAILQLLNNSDVMSSLQGHSTGENGTTLWLLMPSQQRNTGRPDGDVQDGPGFHQVVRRSVTEIPDSDDERAHDLDELGSDGD